MQEGVTERRNETELVRTLQVGRGRWQQQTQLEATHPRVDMRWPRHFEHRREGGLAISRLRFRERCNLGMEIVILVSKKLIAA